MSLATKGGRRVALLARLGLYRLLAPFGHEDYVHFAVLTRSRTGSNLLVSFLNGHPDIFCEGEIFALMRGRNPVGRLESAFGRQPRRVKAKGFKIFYYHPLDADGTALWRRLEAMPGLRIIHLTRNNVLRTLLSRKIAGLQDGWTATRYDCTGVESRRIDFTVRELEEGFGQTREWERAAEARFRAHAVLRLSYEQFTEDPSGTLARILAFLGMRGMAPATGLRKQNPECLGALISNYGELKAAFSNTEWAVYFDE
jgi:LPS sulfotransferase NodH